MRLIRFFTQDQQIHLGIREGGEVLDVTLAARSFQNEEITSPLKFIQRGEEGIHELLQASRAARQEVKSGFFQPFSGMRLDAPLRDAPKLLALAGNFRRHVVESGFQDVEAEEIPLITPQVFCKPVTTCINAPGAPIPIRISNVFVDWEIELAVIIGRGGRDTSREEALDHVFGYSIINDISERKFNSRLSNRKVREADPFFDWLMGKWFDGFAPLGPELVTKDEIPDPHNLSIRLWVNDELMQDANTSQMIFSIPDTIHYVSSVMTLEPGDILAMGTPEGVGLARGVHLKPGDQIRGEIERLGALENHLVSV